MATQGHQPLPQAEGQEVRLDDFEPKWFAQLPDPVYQLMHPSKCCWCMCAIPAGAICVTFLALAAGLLTGLSSTASYAGAGLIDVLAEVRLNETTSMPMLPSQQGPLQASQHAPLLALAAQPAWDHLAQVGAAYVLPLAATSGTEPGRQDPFGRSDDDGGSEAGLPELPSGARIGSPEYRSQMHALADWMRLSAVLQGVEGLLTLLVAVAALPGLLCDGSPLLLRQSAEGRFALTQLRILLALLLTALSPTFNSSALFGAGVSALFTFIFGVHFAGVVYQAARLKHYEATRGAAPSLAGGEPMAPPPHTAHAGTFADVLGPRQGVAPGVRVHTSGVPQSGL